MITPVIIQVLFWIAVVGVVIAGLTQLGQNLLAAVALIVFGPLVARVYAEIFIVLFEINGALQDIRRRTPAGPAVTPGGSLTG